MPQKLLILVVSKTKNHLDSYKFTLLKNKYNFKSIVINLSNDSQQEVNRIINSLNYKPDGVIALIDETSFVASLIAQKLNLNSPSPKAIAQIQHKGYFLSKLKDKKYILPSTIINKSDYKGYKDKFKYPLFIRPVRDTFSQHSMKIFSKKELEDFIEAKKDLTFTLLEKSFFTKQLNQTLDQFICQPLIKYRQYTLEGMVLSNKTKILAITETISDKDKSNFIRFDYPINFNKKIKLKLNKLIKDLTTIFNYNNGIFNIEFFLDNKTNQIYLIEFNTRQSPEFEPLYNAVYTHSITDITIKVSLNRKPDLTKRKIKKIAKSFILRKYQNYLITKLPNSEELNKIKEKYNIETIKIDPKINQKLSDYKQNSYSYRYAVVNVYGKTNKEIFSKFENAKKELNNLITFSPVSD